MRRAGGGDAGQVLVLVIGLTAIAGLLVTGVVDVSRVFLDQRSLHAAADGAAVTAAGALDVDAAYRAGVSDRLPLDPVAARERVAAYVAAADLPSRFVAFEVAGVEVTGTTVTVRLRSRVDLPFVTAVSAQWAGGYPIEVAASARSRVAG